MKRPGDRHHDSMSAGHVLECLATNDSCIQLADALSLTRLDTVLWPAAAERAAITKLDFIRDLCILSDHLLVHLKDRPLSIRRAPAGVSGRSFCQRYWTEYLPPFVHSIVLPNSASSKEAAPYIICNNLETLLYLVEHEALEFRAFTVRLTPELLCSNISAALNKPDCALFVVGTRYTRVEAGRDWFELGAVLPSSFTVDKAGLIASRKDSWGEVMSCPAAPQNLAG